MVDPKIVLMPLSTSGNVRERLNGALSVAQYFGAHLDVLHAQVSPRQFLPEDKIGIPLTLVQELEALASRHSEASSLALRNTFSELCQAHGIPIAVPGTESVATAGWREVNGLRSELVSEFGKTADLLIIPQSKTGKPTSTMQAAMMKTGKPVLLVPRTMERFSAEHVLIGWNASIEGARAISMAMPILKRAASVTIATSEQSDYFRPDGSSVVSYLSAHGVDARFVTFNTEHRSIPEAFLSLAGKLQSDILVMGAFTHRMVTEQLFGGMTRYMVAHSPLPVFVTH